MTEDSITALKIPPILLEGDESAAGTGGTDERKYLVGPSSPTTTPSDRPDLPDGYGTGRLLLIARDSRQLYAHWDLNDEQRKSCSGQDADQQLYLRIYPDAQKDSPVAEVRVDPKPGHCFVGVPAGGNSYIAELGCYPEARAWTPLAISRVVETPPDVPSKNRDFKLGVLQAADTSFAAAFQTASEQPETRPEEEFTPPPRVAWLPIPDPAPAADAEAWEATNRTFGVSPDQMPLWSADQERALEDTSGLVPRTESSPTSPAPAPSSFLEQQAPPGQFWLSVDADIVVYGATERDARVSIGGEPVQLREDGTFSQRMSLPDGEYELIVTAVSVSGDTRQARLRFTRRTSDVPNP